ncbi:MAG: tetratricopeptide repeat protein [Pseudomonadota bacterium]
MTATSDTMHSDPSALAELDRAWRSDEGGGFSNLVTRGAEALRSGDLETALGALQHAEVLNPDDHQVQNLLGLALYKAGSLAEAEARFHVLLERYPDDVTLRMNHAMVQIKRASFASAREDLKRVLQLRPDHKRAAGYLGLACEQLGELAAAARAYQLAGNFPAAEHVLRRHADRVAGGAARTPPAEAEPVPSPPELAAHAPPPTPPEVPRPVATAVPAPVVTAPPVAATEPRPDSESHTHPSKVTDLVAGAGHAAQETNGRNDVIDLGDVAPLESTARVTLLDGLVLLRLDSDAMLRGDLWVGRFGDLDSEPALRRARGAETDQPLGGAHPLISVRGSGTALLRVDEAIAVTATLDGELFVVEPRLLALLGQCRHETARLVMPDGAALSLLRLRGQGQVVLSADRRPARLRITLGIPVVVLASSLLAFVGKVLPRVAPPGPRSANSPPMLHLLGEGEAWVDGGSQLPFEVVSKE